MISIISIILIIIIFFSIFLYAILKEREELGCYRFSIARQCNDNNSVYYEKNESRPIRVRICDCEYARIGFLGFYTRITMDVGIIITHPDGSENVEPNITASG